MFTETDSKSSSKSALHTKVLTKHNNKYWNLSHLSIEITHFPVKIILKTIYKHTCITLFIPSRKQLTHNLHSLMKAVYIRTSFL